MIGAATGASEPSTQPPSNAANPVADNAVSGSKTAGGGALDLSAFGLDERAVPRALQRPPSAAVAHPLDPALEKLIPLLMRPVLFALAHERPEMSVLRPRSLGLRDDFSPKPKKKFRGGPIEKQLAWVTARKKSATASVPDLPEVGVAKPSSFRIDDEGKTPIERDAPATTSEREPPPRPGRYLRPRTPLPRAPLTYLDGTAFRLDKRTGALPNESMIESRPQPQYPSWYLEAYDRDWARRWTPFIYIWGLGPLQNEWFAYWWVEFREQTLGAQYPFPYREDREIKWLIILRCKEQMMIRRDVKKLEKAPEPSEWYADLYGMHINQHERILKLGELIEKPTWVEITRIVRDNHEALQPWRDAYSDWRFLLGGLEER